jgi:thiol-disulfide isomerase/thioredoxin
LKILSLLALFATALAAQPKLTRIDESGYRKLIQSQSGHVTLVDFWATWCAPCRQELPLLAGLESRLRSKGVRLLTVSADDPEQERAAADFLKKSGLSGPAYLRQASDDDKFIRTVEPKWSGALPALFVYDRQGKLVQSFVGETEIGVVEAAVRKIL